MHSKNSTGSIFEELQPSFEAHFTARPLLNEMAKIPIGCLLEHQDRPYLAIDVDIPADTEQVDDVRMAPDMGMSQDQDLRSECLQNFPFLLVPVETRFETGTLIGEGQVEIDQGLVEGARCAST
jgi:hypothetical protein